MFPVILRISLQTDHQSKSSLDDVVSTGKRQVNDIAVVRSDEIGLQSYA